MRTASETGPSDLYGVSAGCGGASPGSGMSTIDLNAGASVTAKWSQLDPSHKGPVTEYMAACPESGCDGVDATSLDWFKIAEDVYENGVWGSSKISDSLEYTFSIPTDLRSGNYLVRHDVLALHEPGAPQLYPYCFQARLASDGNVVPTDTVRIPEAYNDGRTNAYIQWSIYDGDQTQFVNPGPAVYNGQGGAPRQSGTGSPRPTSTSKSWSTSSSNKGNNGNSDGNNWDNGNNWNSDDNQNNGGKDWNNDKWSNDDNKWSNDDNKWGKDGNKWSNNDNKWNNDKSGNGDDNQWWKSDSATPTWSSTSQAWESASASQTAGIQNNRYLQNAESTSTASWSSEDNQDWDAQASTSTSDWNAPSETADSDNGNNGSKWRHHGHGHKHGKWNKGQNKSWSQDSGDNSEWQDNQDGYNGQESSDDSHNHSWKRAAVIARWAKRGTNIF